MTQAATTKQPQAGIQTTTRATRTGLTLKRTWRMALLSLGVATLMGCAQTPTPPWQGSSTESALRGVQAYLVGMPNVARLEFERARSALSSTANLEAVANVELLQCAVRAASLESVYCNPSIDASAMSQAQRVYRDYLNGKLPSVEQRALLPKAQQQVALAIGSGGDIASVVRDLVQAAQRPDAQLLSALLACGIAEQHKRAPLEVATLAVDMASAQGWRKPLLAWLNQQAQLAQAAGNEALAQQSRQRIALLTAAQ